MPTTEHETLVELFRDNPPLAPRLIETLFDVNVPPHKQVAVGDSALNQTMSVEFRADVVLELEDEAKKTVMAIIVEVQREVDSAKKKAWPVYVTVERSRKDCPAIVLVVTTNAAVSTWASKPIDVGLGLTIMTPLVLGPAVIPVITDPALVRSDPALALLSALCHDEGEHGREVVLTVEQTLVQSSHELAKLFFGVIYNHVRQPLKRAIEAMLMEQKVENSDVELPGWAQALVNCGMVAGELKGELKGKLEATRSTLQRQLKRAKIELTEEQRARIDTCSNLALLDRWTENVIGAKTAADVFDAE